MQPMITLVTLGVDDLQRSLRFYRDGLGFPTEGIVGEQFEYGAVAFFQLQPGLRLAIGRARASRTIRACPSAGAARPNSRSRTTCAVRTKSTRS